MKNVILILLGIFLICACACVAIFGGSALLVATAQPIYNIPSNRMDAGYLSNLSSIAGYVEIDPGANTFITDPRVTSKLFTKSSIVTGTGGEISEYILVQTGQDILDPTDVVARLDRESCVGKVSTNITNGVIAEYKGHCGGRAYYFLEKSTEGRVILFETAEMGQAELEAFIKAYVGL